MRLSPTTVLKYESCPQQYCLEEIQRVKTVHKAANLIFGSAMHKTLEQWLRHWLLGQAYDAGADFERRWHAAQAAGGIEYSATQTPESMAETGQRLAAQFAQAWPGFGLLPVLSAQGEPLLESKLEVDIAPGLLYVGKLDLLALDLDGRLHCLDFKTPSSATDPAWLKASDQLLGYQLLLDAHAERLGIPLVEWIGLLELIKRKVPKRQGKGPEVCTPITIPRHPQADLDAYRAKLEWVAEDIDRGRFPRRGLMAHNSPCAMCALKGLCQDGDLDGIILPDKLPNVRAA